MFVYEKPIDNPILMAETRVTKIYSVDDWKCKENIMKASIILFECYK